MNKTELVSYIAEKTECSKKQAEEMIKAKIPIIVLDGMGSLSILTPAF